MKPASHTGGFGRGANENVTNINLTSFSLSKNILL